MKEFRTILMEFKLGGALFLIQKKTQGVRGSLRKDLRRRGFHVYIHYTMSLVRNKNHFQKFNDDS